MSKEKDNRKEVGVNFLVVSAIGGFVVYGIIIVLASITGLFAGFIGGTIRRWTKNKI